MGGTQVAHVFKYALTLVDTLYASLINYNKFNFFFLLILNINISQPDPPH